MRDLEAALAEFVGRVAGLTVSGPHRYPIEQLRIKASSAYTDWASSSGIYFFEQAGEVQYIGRALPGSGLRARVHNQCTAYDDPKWDAVIKDSATTVGVVALSSDDWYWAAALEAFLIARCSPAHNRRSS